MHPIYEKFVDYLKSNYPTVTDDVISRLTPNLISPFTLKIPAGVLEQAQKIITEVHQLSQSPTYKTLLFKDFPWPEGGFQPTPSVLSSLDCHLNVHGQLKIIEINTNASSYLVNLENYTSRRLKTFPQARQKLLQSFTKTFTPYMREGALVLILDEEPEQQNLFVEFQMYKNLLEKTFKVRCEFADLADLTAGPDGALIYEGIKVSAIYNRHTDFYFANSPVMKAAYAKNETLISPNPWGYTSLADKRRLLMWNYEFFATISREEGLEFPNLKKALLETKKFSDFKSADELWAERGRYFFKPPNSYGGKSVYKGKSISRTVFQRIYNPEYLAQEAVPAPEVTLNYDGTDHTLKYDLRFYFFEGEVQFANARLYQGQLTNLQTPFGGLTPLEII